jgi:hypothetical protein
LNLGVVETSSTAADVNRKIAERKAKMEMLLFTSLASATPLRNSKLNDINDDSSVDDHDEHKDKKLRRTTNSTGSTYRDKDFIDDNDDIVEQAKADRVKQREVRKEKKKTMIQTTIQSGFDGAVSITSKNHMMKQYLQNWQMKKLLQENSKKVKNLSSC